MDQTGSFQHVSIFKTWIKLVRIWDDATYPSLTFLSILQLKLGDTQIEGLSAPVSVLDFCSTFSGLIVSNESVFGMVVQACGLFR
ncbi:unnamed protein product [Rhodiola kirilowii]